MILHIATKGEATIKAAAEMRSRSQMLLDAGRLDVGELATGVAISIQRAHLAAEDDFGAVRSQQPDRIGVGSQFSDVREQMAPLLDVALMPRVEGLMVPHVDDELATARCLHDALGVVGADQAVGRGGQVASHVGDHDGRQNVIRMIDGSRRLHGSVEHILWGANQEHVINIYHIGSAGHNAAQT